VSSGSDKANLEEQCRIRMGDDLGQVFFALWNEVLRLNLQWKDYQHLYGSQEGVDVLISTAPALFRRIRDLYRSYFILSLSRFIDPAETRKRGRSHPNLSLQQLNRAVQEHPDCSAIAAQVTELIKAAQQACRAYKDWRDKTVAHRDLALSLDPTRLEQLPPVTPENMDRAIESLGAVLTPIYQRFIDNADICYSPVSLHGDGSALLKHLRRSANFESRKKDCRLRGESPPEDPLRWSPPDLQATH